MSSYLSHPPHSIHYRRFGNGQRLLFCLHGYGENGSSFEGLAGLLEDEYTVICPDLPFHGKSSWHLQTFDPPQLHSVLEALAGKEGFSGTGFSIAGYSMGGRLALSYAQYYYGWVDQLVLIAPDGLKMNPWYWLATQTRVGNNLFRYTMEHPRWLFNAMNLTRRVGLLNQSIYKFSRHYLNDQQQRRNLYERWTLFRRFRPDRTIVRLLLKRGKLYSILVFGKFDRIIPPAQGRHFMKGMEGSAEMWVLNAGHRLLKPPFTSTIAEIIRQKGKR